MATLGNYTCKSFIKLTQVSFSNLYYERHFEKFLLSNSMRK